MNIFGFNGRSKSAREVRPPREPRPSPRTPPPSSEASLSLRTDRLQERLASHDRELLRLRGQLRATKKGTRQYQFYSNRAAQVLRQKKSLEKRLATAMDMRYNLTIAQDEADATAALARLQPRRTHAAGISNATQMLRGMENPAPEDVEDLMDDVKEQMRDIREVTDILGSEDFLNERGIDDAELEEELMQEMAELEEREPRRGTAGDAHDMANEDYLKRIDDLMPTPNQVRPQPYRAPTIKQEPRARPSRQQRTARRGGY